MTLIGTFKAVTVAGLCFISYRLGQPIPSPKMDDFSVTYTVHQRVVRKLEACQHIVDEHMPVTQDTLGNWNTVIKPTLKGLLK